ncbi:MAG TPA: DUF4232 domain-containing protein [Gaiellaceae bacterium]|nr:DUF4232 domain-containing protein [Gaiellaceae bacterium]
MAGRRVAAGLVLPAVALTAAGCLGSGTKTVTVTHNRTVTSTKTVTTTGSVSGTKPCTGAQVAGTFTLVPNSAGAGQIAYALTLKNASSSPCLVRGVPQATLLDASGTPLPTHIRAAEGGKRPILLPPGASALAQARFSPDVAGDGDSQTGACQPTAHTLQVTAAGGGVAEAPIKPPTSVCQQGTLNFEPFGYAR